LRVTEWWRPRKAFRSSWKSSASSIAWVLQKLLGYRKSNMVSERQGNDVLGVLKVQRADLDFNYLKKWAEQAGVGDLLKKALEEAGLVL
jgi:hypothetical protein